MTKFAEQLGEELRADSDSLGSLGRLLDSLLRESADVRLRRLNGELRRLEKELEHSATTIREFQAAVERESAEVGAEFTDGRTARVIGAALDVWPTSLSAMSGAFLDRLLGETDAEKGFIISYVPESTEADVIAARNFQTRNLSLAEYDFSRTLLREVLKQGKPLLLDDASSNSDFSSETSVRTLSIKSVAVAPISYQGRTVGALYLENNSIPCNFTHEDLKLLNGCAKFLVFYLLHARLLPQVFEQESRVFFDAKMASKQIIGNDPKIIALLNVIERLADSPAIVLIEGESGTGKELVAQSLHYLSSRRDNPFVAINCAAIPENLIESELFGHEKGAFTGATEKYIGRIEQARGGTLLLDEINELAYPLQAKLLRFLQSNEFQRLGGKDTISVDVRVVAATSKNLKQLVERGSFQEALFYRLNVVPVRVPTLRERRGDIRLLADYFLAKFRSIYARPVRMDDAVYECLRLHPFAGNVRELENLIHRLVALTTDNTIRIGDLPSELLADAPTRVSIAKDSPREIATGPPSTLAELEVRRRAMRQELGSQERELIERAIRETNGNLTEAAARLGIHRVTLHRILKRTDKQQGAGA